MVGSNGEEGCKWNLPSIQLFLSSHHWLSLVLVPTGCRDYFFHVILISNHRLIHYKIHHQKMEEQKQLFHVSSQIMYPLLITNLAQNAYEKIVASQSRQWIFYRILITLYLKEWENKEKVYIYPCELCIYHRLLTYSSATGSRKGWEGGGWQEGPVGPTCLIFLWRSLWFFFNNFFFMFYEDELSCRGQLIVVLSCLNLASPCRPVMFRTRMNKYTIMFRQVLMFMH